MVLSTCSFVNFLQLEVINQEKGQKGKREGGGRRVSEKREREGEAITNVHNYKQLQYS